MIKPPVTDGKWNQWCNASGTLSGDAGSMFGLFFERSPDAIWLFDPRQGVFVDCNNAAVALMRAGSKEQLIGKSPVDLSPPHQADGIKSSEVAGGISETISRNGSHRFEWLIRRLDGADIWMEVLGTDISVGDRALHLVVSRDISERKESERRLRESEERFRALFERSADAMSIFDPQLGRFIDSNAAVVAQTGAPDKEALGHASPEEISPERQPDGRLSSEKAQEMIQLALANGSHRFEWMTRRFDGTELPIDIVMTAMPYGDRTLLLAVSRDISEQRQAENEIRRLNATLERSIAERTAELSASEARLRTLIEHAPEAIVVFDGETGRFISCNENATQLYGLPREQLLQRHPAELSPSAQPDGRPSMDAAREWIGRALAGETPVFEWMHRHSSGRRVPCEVRLVRLPSDGRSVVRGSVIDNTERKRAELALQRRTEQGQRHRNALLELALLDKSDFLTALATICARTADVGNLARVSYWSLQDDETALVCEMLYLHERGGLDPAAKGFRIGAADYPSYFSALCTRKPIAASHAATHPDTHELSDPYLRSLGIASLLDVPVWLHGKLVGVLCHEHVGEPREWTPEEIDFASAVATMVSLSIEAAQRTRSEQALRESEQKFRALFEATSQGVMLHDEHQILEVNPAALRIIRQPRAEDVIGRHPVDLAPPKQPNGEDSATVAQRHIAACMEKGSTRFEWLSAGPNGEELQLEVILTVINMGGRQLIQAVIDDISGRKRAEAELLRALAREKELNALKGSFVSMVSHEFRTPLGIIMSSAEILGDYLEELDPQERGHHLESITRNVRRMGELMEEVLLLGRLDAGRMEFKAETLDLRNLFHRLADEVKSATDDLCPIRVTTHGLPAEADADESLLRHIFTNLLSNAVKYSEPGSPVEFAIHREGGDALCLVRDRGIGIPDGDQSWLFNSFQRGPNVGQRPGTGLGLVIVKRCVELHGGEIQIDSRLGEGTTVTVRIPVFGKS